MYVAPHNPRPTQPQRPVARRRQPWLGWRRALLAACVALLSWGALAAPAFAEQDPAKANALFKQAKAKLEAGHSEEALALVTRAASYFAHPAIFLLKAKTLVALGRYGKAMAVLQGISARKLPSSMRKARAAAIKKSKAAMAAGGHLVVTVSPKEAVVTVAGKAYRNGVDTWLKAGKYRLEATAPGYRDKGKTVQIEVGDQADIRLGLRRLEGTLRVQVPGGLSGVVLKIDGEVWDVDTAKRAGDRVAKRVPVGAHEVACGRGSLLELHQAKVELGKTVVVRCTQIGSGPSALVVRSLGWGGVATGLAIAGYGAWGLGSYFGDVARADREGLVLETNKHYGGALYLASGIGMGLASYLFLVRGSKDEGEDTAALLRSLEPSPTATYSAAVR